MSKDKNSTVKFLIFILVFLIIVLLLLIIFVIPGIKSYKSNSSELKLLEKKSIRLKSKEELLKKELDSFKIENEKILKRLESEFNIDDFVNFSQKYLKDVNVTLLPKSNNSKFQEYNISATTTQKSPKSFYKFLDSLQEYTNVIKITFPIKMVSKTDHIALNFHIIVGRL